MKEATPNKNPQQIPHHSNYDTLSFPSTPLNTSARSLVAAPFSPKAAWYMRDCRFFQTWVRQSHLGMPAHYGEPGLVAPHARERLSALRMSEQIRETNVKIAALKPDMAGGGLASAHKDRIALVLSTHTRYGHATQACNTCEEVIATRDGFRSCRLRTHFGVLAPAGNKRLRVGHAKGKLGIVGVAEQGQIRLTQLPSCPLHAQEFPISHASQLPKRVHQY